MDYNLHALTLAELLKLYQAVGRELFTRYWMGLVVLFWVVLVWTDYATDKYISRLFRCICNALKGKKK